MPKNKANYSETRRDDWRTPSDLFHSLDNIFNFAVDLAADPYNTLCADYCSIEDDDGFFYCSSNVFAYLTDRWCWCNPPYGSQYGGLPKWITHIHETVPKAIVLIPAAPGNNWWHDLVWPNAKSVTFIRGRLQFEGAPQVAQFDSALLAMGYNARVDEFERAKLLEFGVFVDGWCVD